MTLRRGLLPALAAAFVLVGGTPAHAQAGLEDAKALYASAAYAEALEAMRDLAGEAVTREVRHYRALCLLALGRRTDAEREVAAVVERDPLYVPAGDEVTPRLVTLFRDARRRLLPTIVHREFVSATRLYLDGDAPGARTAFDRVLKLLAEPPLSERSELRDLRLAAAGFADRIVAAPAPADEPATLPAAAAAAQ
jgi:hypothetical protein